MILSELPNELIGWTGALVAGVIGLVIGIQRAVKQWAGNSLDLQKVQGEMDVVSLLRAELERMRIQNDKLATLVNKLQTQLIDMTGKNARMKQQIEMLDFELKSMRGPQGLHP